ncbi:MAG: hypothetical protein K2X43_24660 [Hyphomonadaceae bacterium]|nr:hypothetical protein [Hyphomonadaceae bacterium]
MKRSVHIARLAIALIAFANATAALTVPRALAHTATGTPPAIETTGCRQVGLKVQRPPRVPRRERLEADQMAAPAAGSDA